MKKVLVINAYGDKNIGDAAILSVALSFIDSQLDQIGQIDVLCESIAPITPYEKLKSRVRVHQLPYGYAIRSTGKPASILRKLYRFVEIYVVTYILIAVSYLSPKLLPGSGMYHFIRLTREADAVFGMGGGYLTTKEKYTDYFGLLLTLLPIYVGKIFKKKLLLLPMSIGSFADRHHEQLAVNALKHTTIFCRDELSLRKLKMLDTGNTIKKLLAPDLALYFNKDAKQDLSRKDNYIALTAREWLGNIEQKKYEQALALFINYLWRKHKLKTIFIPMAANPIEDDDNRVAERLAKITQPRSLEITKSRNLVDIQRLIQDAHIAVCTRMHSAILATTTATPFISIAYGTKTLGYLKLIRQEKWNIDISAVSFDKLKVMYATLAHSQSYKKFIEELKKYNLSLTESEKRIKQEINKALSI